MKSADDWAKRAWEHTRVLAKGIGPRGATSDAERRAAKYVRDELKRLGLAGVRLESFRGAVSGWLPLSVAFSLAAWGMLIGLLLGRVGAVVAALLYAFSTWVVFRELYPKLDAHPLRRKLWRGDSQNVVAVVPPTGPVAGRVVLMSYLDSARCPFWWRTERRRRWAGRLALPIFASLPVCAVSFLLAALSGGVWFYWIPFLALWPQIAALFFSLRADRSPFGPGANHNATGVGTHLALAERLAQSPLERTDVWLVATGCRETGGDGLRALLGTHGALLADATFVALEGVGVGEQVVCLDAERAAQGHDISVRRHRGGPTEIGTLNRSGFNGLIVSVWPQEGRASAGRRRLDDTFDTIDREALAQAHSFAWSFLQAIDVAAERAEL